jgi:transposase
MSNRKEFSRMRKRTPTPDEIRRMNDAYANGTTQDEIGGRFNLGRDTVRKYLVRKKRGGLLCERRPNDLRGRK